MNTRVNRHGSISIEREYPPPPVDDNDTWNLQPSNLNPTNYSTPPAVGLEALRNSGASFAQRQLELDSELERLSQQLLEATPPNKPFSNPDPNLLGFPYTTTATPSSQQLVQHQSIGRLLQQSSQRHYNWRSPGYLELDDTQNQPQSQPQSQPSLNAFPSSNTTNTNTNNNNNISTRVSRQGSIVIERSTATLPSPNLIRRSPGLKPISMSAAPAKLDLAAQRAIALRSPGLRPVAPDSAAPPAFALDGPTEAVRRPSTTASWTLGTEPPPPPPPSQPTVNNISTRISRRGSIIIERHPNPPTAHYPPQPTPAPSQDAWGALQQEHENVVHQLQTQIAQLHTKCMQLKQDNGDVLNELNIVRTRSTHLMSQVSENEARHTQEQEQDVARRREVEQVFHLLRAKDNELVLLRDQQDRTMNLLNTCTQQRDLLVNDNRMLRNELDNLLKRFNYDGGGGGGGGPHDGGTGVRVDLPRVREEKTWVQQPSGLAQNLSDFSKTLDLNHASPATEKKIFCSANRRSSRVNASESSYQVINVKTSARKKKSATQ